MLELVGEFEAIYIVYILALIILHEIGHYIAARFLGFKARFGFSIRYISPYVSFDYGNRIKCSDYMFIMLMGLWVSMPLTIFGMLSYPTDFFFNWIFPMFWFLSAGGDLFFGFLVLKEMTYNPFYKYIYPTDKFTIVYGIKK